MIAYYMRLSRAQDREGESESIENQRKVLMDYQRRHVDLGGSKTVKFDPPHLEYIDDGFTGTNFKRPGWTRLIEDCRKGKVKTIMAKDVSRIGRNYIEVEDYLNQIFPMLGVRVICVMENYDSGEAIESEIISLENIMNTYYVKDMRKKVDASIINRLKHGKVVTRVTPFGYVCDDVKEGWKKDPEAAKTVRLIFKEAVAGKSTSEIAKLLNEKGAETPGDVRNRRGEGKRDPVMRETKIWTSSMVSDIIRNEQYTGIRISRKSRKDRFGKVVKTETDEQLHTENDHEALVSMKNFKLAQNVLRPYVSAGKKKNIDAVEKGDPETENRQKALLSGLLRCGKCHRMMVISGNTAHCERERILSDSAGPVSMSLVEAKTWAALKTKAKLAKRLLGQETEKPDVDGLEAEVRELKERLMDSYEAFADGKITREEYIAFRDENRARTAETEQKLSYARGEYLIRRKEALEPLAGIAEAEPTRELLLRTIDAVYWNGEDVELKLKADEFLNE